MANDSNHLIHQRSEIKSNETSNDAETSHKGQKALRSFYPLHRWKRPLPKSAPWHTKCQTWAVSCGIKNGCVTGLRWKQENMTLNVVQLTKLYTYICIYTDSVVLIPLDIIHRVTWTSKANKREHFGGSSWVFAFRDSSKVPQGMSDSSFGHPASWNHVKASNHVVYCFDQQLVPALQAYRIMQLEPKCTDMLSTHAKALGRRAIVATCWRCKKFGLFTALPLSTPPGRVLAIALCSCI